MLPKAQTVSAKSKCLRNLSNGMRGGGKMYKCIRYFWITRIWGNHNLLTIIPWGGESKPDQLLISSHSGSTPSGSFIGQKCYRVNTARKQISALPSNKEQLRMYLGSPTPWKSPQCTLASLHCSVLPLVSAKVCTSPNSWVGSFLPPLHVLIHFFAIWDPH